MRVFIMSVIASTSLIVVPAIAKDRKPVDPAKKLCRKYETTGSLMPGKSVCHTAAEWAAIDGQNETNAQGMQEQSHRVLGGAPAG